MTSTPVTTFLFTDIEESTRLWEQQPQRMGPALAAHDRIAHRAVSDHRGAVVKTTGDGVLAVFDDPLGAVSAVVQLQLALADLETTHGLAIRVRCGLHVGVDERRDDDVFGREVNRTARIMGAAHGGQTLLSQAAALLVRDRLPEGLALRGLGSVRLRGFSTPERVYQLSHPGLRETFPALRALDAVPNNLPQQLTSFVGRESAIADIRKLLQSHRLLTLIGAGGIGKTRLALQAAAELLDQHSDGIWFVDLAPLSDANLVAQAVASTLGVKEERGRPVVEALLRSVGDRALLIVLDNCEHLLDACAEIAHRLLQAGARIRILASSREPLHIAGEVTLPVSPLSLPRPGSDTTVDELWHSGAAQLFVDRATAARPGFEVTAGNAATIADICRRLDGIPLALELAAARVRSMSVAGIASRLGDRFLLLTGGERTALPRQQTLRALIDWSYDLLDENERALLRRLAVFAGGWTVEAAEAVCADECVRRDDVLDLLARLVEKSLVVLDADGERYRLLDTIGEYASQRLEHSGETAAARRRHRDYVVAYVERVFPELFGDRQVSWLARLDRELDNVLAAHASCAGDPEAGALDLRLVHAIKPYYYNRGLLELALRITLEALRHSGAAERNFLRCRSLFDAGQLCSFMGEYATAQAYLQESLAIAREIGDRQRVASVLQPLGMAALGQGDAVAAHDYLNEALAMARDIGVPREVAAALNALAQYHRSSGNSDSAETLYREVHAIAREHGDRETMAIALLNLAMVAIVRGVAGESGAMLVDALRILDDLGSHPIGQSVIEVSAGLAALQRDWTRSARYFGIAEAHAKRTGLHRDPVDEAFLMPRVHAAREALGEAAFSAAVAAGRALTYQGGIDDVRAWLNEAAGPNRAQ